MDNGRTDGVVTIQDAPQPREKENPGIKTAVDLQGRLD